MTGEWRGCSFAQSRCEPLQIPPNARFLRVTSRIVRLLDQNLAEKANSTEQRQLSLGRVCRGGWQEHYTCRVLAELGRKLESRKLFDGILSKEGVNRAECGR